MAEIRPYVVLQDWMFDLKLTLPETVALAVIYGYSQDGQHLCHVSYDYLARYCGQTRRNAVNVLGKLVEAGLVEKVERPGKYNGFRVLPQGVKNFHPRGEKFSREGEKISPLSPTLSPTPPISSSFPDNNIINNTLSAGACADTHTREDDSENAAPADSSPTPQPPAPSEDFRFVSSMEREALRFDRDRIAAEKRRKMAAQLDGVCRAMAMEGLEMDADQRRRFLDHWCSHRPGSEEIRAEGDPYFSLPAKARRWAEGDRERAAAGGESRFRDATSDWRNGDFPAGK